MASRHQQSSDLFYPQIIFSRQYSWVEKEFSVKKMIWFFSPLFGKECPIIVDSPLTLQNADCSCKRKRRLTSLWAESQL